MNDDNYLINEYKDGDQDSFRIIIERYTPIIYNYSVRFVGIDNANDITQEVFIKVWKNIKNFDPKKSQFKTWIFVITRNTITDFFRKKKAIPFSNMDNEEGLFSEKIEDENDLPDVVYDKLKDKEFLDNFLDNLNPDWKAVISLYYQEDMNFREIAEVLEKPINTVKSYHYRTIQKLKKICTKNE